MSLFRCLYGRVSLIKSSCGEVYAFNISSKGSQSVVTHCLLFCNQKNLSQMTCSLKNKQPFEKVSVLSQSSSAPPLSLVENGNKERNSLVVDSWCSKKSVSEGYYRNKWKHKRSDKTNDNKNHDHAKCEFNFNSINVRLLETFGVIVSKLWKCEFCFKIFLLTLIISSVWFTCCLAHQHFYVPKFTAAVLSSVFSLVMGYSFCLVIIWLD